MFLQLRFVVRESFEAGQWCSVLLPFSDFVIPLQCIAWIACQSAFREEQISRQSSQTANVRTHTHTQISHCDSSVDNHVSYNKNRVDEG